MDVVKRNIEAMRGYLDIESPPDKGSKFSMKLPLTLAIIDGMLISVGEEKLIVPTLSVVESVRLSPDMIFTVTDKAEMINLRGNLLPLIRINRLLGLPDRENEGGNRTVVVVEEAVSRAGLVIDELLGQRQVVIKSLGPVFEHQKWVSGGAILSDGRIGLIIDVIGIIKLAQTVEVPVASAFQDAASEFKAEMDAYKEERIGSEEKNHGDEGSPKLPTTVGQRDKETGKEYYEEAEIEKREAVVTG